MTKSKQTKEPKRLQRFYNFLLAKQHQDKQTLSSSVKLNNYINKSNRKNNSDEANLTTITTCSSLSSLASTSRKSFTTGLISSFAISLFKLITVILIVYALGNTIFLNSFVNAAPLTQSNIDKLPSQTNKTLKLNIDTKKTAKAKDDDYYDYEQYDENKSDVAETEYNELNERLLTKTEAQSNETEFKQVSKTTTATAAALASTKNILPSSSSIKHLSKQSNSKHSTKTKANDDEYYDYGQEDYYQLAAGDLKTVKDGMLSSVTESNPMSVLPSSSATSSTTLNTKELASVKTVYDLDETVVNSKVDKLDEVIKELMTPSIKLVTVIKETKPIQTTSTVTSTTLDQESTKM
jgi:hypothetical protein